MNPSETNLSNDLHNQSQQAYNNPAEATRHIQDNYQGENMKADAQEGRDKDERAHAEKNAQLGNTTSEELANK